MDSDARQYTPEFLNQFRYKFETTIPTVDPSASVDDALITATSYSRSVKFLCPSSLPTIRRRNSTSKDTLPSAKIAKSRFNQQE